MGRVYSHTIKKYTFLAKTSLASKVAYPLDVFVRTFFFALVLFIFTQLWGSLLGSDNSIAGFTRSQLVWYLMVTESIMLSNARIERRIDDDVKSGAVAYILVRPLHFIWYQCAIYFGETLGHLIFNVLIGGLVAALLVGAPHIGLATIPVILIIMLLAFLLQFLIKMSIALLSFWVEDTTPFFWVYSKILFTLGGLFVPIEVYPDWLKKLAQALPFNYVLYQPAKLFVAFEWRAMAQVALTQLFWVFVLMAVASFIYGRGVKRVSVNGG